MDAGGATSPSPLSKTIIAEMAPLGSVGVEITSPNGKYSVGLQNTNPLQLEINLKKKFLKRCIDC